MMPVGTPPNAMVFGTGRIRIGEMIRAGFWLNIVSIVVIVIMCLLFAGNLITSIQLN
jgi:sodium-dependent dicarboxylate transporter 2/3/5